MNDSIVKKRKGTKLIFAARKGEEVTGILYFRKTLIVATTKRVLEFAQKGKQCKTRKRK